MFTVRWSNTSIALCIGLLAMGCARGRKQSNSSVDAGKIVDGGSAMQAAKPRGRGPEGSRACSARAARPAKGPAELADKGPCRDHNERARLGGFEQFILPLVVVTPKHADGSLVVDADWVQRDIATANRVLNPGGIRLGLFLFIISDSLPTDVTKDNVTAVKNDPVFHNYPDNLVVLYADSYYDGGGVSFNDGSGVVVYKWANTDNYQLLAHEVSHSLGLDHTQCDQVDDDVDDTPQDPTPGGWDCANGVDTPATCSCSGACPCTGSCTAPLQAYHPDVLNVMAKYQGKPCAEHFTPGQYELMRCVLRTVQRPRMRCPANKIACGDPLQCVWESDPQNCNGCGNHCAENQVCTPTGCQANNCDPGCPQSKCHWCCTGCDGKAVCAKSEKACKTAPECSDPCAQ